ncbi:MAG: hypothetical protein MRY64_16305 [Hyphomonadaceae bacterium]|nr:hypothetical protein [Hyphomonadaceae bacterium]
MELDVPDEGGTSLTVFQGHGLRAIHLPDLQPRIDVGPRQGLARSAYAISDDGDLIVLGAMSRGHLDIVDLRRFTTERLEFDFAEDVPDVPVFKTLRIVNKVSASRRFIYGNAILYPFGIPARDLLKMDLQSGEAELIALPVGFEDFLANTSGDIIASLHLSEGRYALASGIGKTGELWPAPFETVRQMAVIGAPGRETVVILGQSLDGRTGMWIWRSETGFTELPAGAGTLGFGADLRSGEFLWIETFSGIEAPPEPFQSDTALLSALSELWAEGFRDFEVLDSNHFGTILGTAVSGSNRTVFLFSRQDPSIEILCFSDP